MFGRHEIAPLLKREGKDSSPVLSLYLDVDLSRPAKDKYEKKQIKTGLSDGINIEVTEGLKKTDKIKLPVVENSEKKG